MPKAWIYTPIVHKAKSLEPENIIKWSKAFFILTRKPTNDEMKQMALFSKSLVDDPDNAKVTSLYSIPIMDPQELIEHLENIHELDKKIETPTYKKID